jgi:predicted RND superfamily exporter protein
VTTVGAFLSFLVSDFPSFQYFGIFCAFGILVALVLTFTIMPVLLYGMPRFQKIAVWDLSAPRATESWGALSDDLVGMAATHHNKILVGAGLLLVFSLAGASRVEVDSDIGSLMGNANPLMEWSDWIENNFRSPESLEIEIELAETTSILDPASLHVVQAIEEHLQSGYSDLGQVRSVLDPIRRMNYFMSGEAPKGAVIPSLSEAEKLQDIFFQLDSETRDQWAPTGRRHVRLSVEAPSISTSQQRLIVDSVTRHLKETLPEGWSFKLTGSLPIFEAMMNKLLDMQVRAFLGASLTVALCLFVYFGFAWRLTMLALLPNILPVVAVLGFLGWGGIPLDVGTAIVGPLIIGIAVDDSIHIFTEYRNALGQGLKPSEAIRCALCLVERPVITSSGTLCAGFLTLAVLTRFGVIQTFGVVFSLAVFTALLADLVLIPALIHRFPDAISPTPSE